MPNYAIGHAMESDVVGRLASFFPEATPVRIPIKLSRTHSSGDGNGYKGEGVQPSDNVFLQETVIEFGTPHEVLFTIEHPLEFADHVLIESSDGALHAEASVVALQYHPKRTAVAARFLAHVPNWIVKS